MATFQGCLFAEGTYTGYIHVTYITHMLIKSNLNRLQGITHITHKRTHLCIKRTRYHAKKYIRL